MSARPAVCAHSGLRGRPRTAGTGCLPLRRSRRSDLPSWDLRNWEPELPQEDRREGRHLTPEAGRCVEAQQPDPGRCLEALHEGRRLRAQFMRCRSGRLLLHGYNERVKVRQWVDRSIGSGAWATSRTTVGKESVPRDMPAATCPAVCVPPAHLRSTSAPSHCRERS